MDSSFLIHFFVFSLHWFAFSALNCWDFIDFLSLCFFRFSIEFVQLLEFCSSSFMARGTTQPDTESEYFVHPSEGPNSLTVSPKLNGSNYLAWKRSMQRALGTKNKLGFIKGNIHVPDSDDLLCSAWERCNHLVQSWLINSLSGSLIIWYSCFLWFCFGNLARSSWAFSQGWSYTHCQFTFLYQFVETR